jgi:hypothetical protein
MTIVWGVVIILYLPDGPHNAKILTEYERVVAIWRISKNQTGIKDPKILPHQIKEALLDPKTYLLLLMAACYGILNGGVANFISSLIKGFGFSPLKTSLLQTPGGAFELVMCIAFGYLSTYKNMLGITIIRKNLVFCFPTRNLPIFLRAKLTKHFRSWLHSWNRWSCRINDDRP